MTPEERHEHLCYLAKYLARKTEIDADDLVQETHIKILHSPYIEEGTEKGWLYLVMKSVLTDMGRRRGARPTTVRGEVDSYYFDEYPSLAEDLPEMLKLLNSKYRQAVVLRHIEGYSLAEIVNITNSTIATVKSRLQRAAIQLREAIK